MKKLGSLKTVHRAELKIKSPGENSKPIEEKKTEVVSVSWNKLSLKWRKIKFSAKRRLRARVNPKHRAQDT